MASKRCPHPSNSFDRKGDEQKWCHRRNFPVNFSDSKRIQCIFYPNKEKPITCVRSRTRTSSKHHPVITIHETVL